MPNTIFKSKTVAFHCGIKGNEKADSLAKKGSNIMQSNIKSTSFYSAKTHIHKTTRINAQHQLTLRTSGK
jgi:hypothetical protein